MLIWNITNFDTTLISQYKNLFTMINGKITASEYCKNRAIKQHTTFVYANGCGIWHYQGKQYTDAEFNEMFPTHLPIIGSEELRKFKGDNPDTTKIKK